jgi:3',5'-nucleoside bisphosphate phosphatase
LIDLHCHTTVSDGGDSPSELVAKAAAAGLDAIAVTDHDNDAGCSEAVDAGIERGVEVVRGVEISCDVEGLRERGYEPSARPTMHLLGYFIPESDNPLSGALAELQYHRANRNRLIVERLNDLGIPVTFEEVEAEAGGPGAQIGRPHFASVLVRHGAVSEYQQAFDRYLAKGAKAYIGRKLYKPGEAVELMISAGAVPVFAHPFTLNLESSQLDRFTDELAEAGLRGIEAYHGDWTEDDQRPLRDMAERRGLVVTGGSDYHGDMRPDRSMPGGKTGVIAPERALEDLRAVAGELQGA